MLMFMTYYNYIEMKNSSVKGKGTNRSNLFRKESFVKNCLSKRFRFSRYFYEMEDFNLHTGIDHVSKKQNIVLCNIFREKDEQDYFIHRQPKLAEKEDLKFCNFPIWSQIKKMNKKSHYFQVYSKKGCSIHEYLSQLKQIKYEHIHFLLVLILELVQQMHNSLINFKYFDWKILFLTLNEEKSKLRIETLDVGIKKKNQNESKCIRNSKQNKNNKQNKILRSPKSKDRKNGKVQFNFRNEYFTNLSNKRDLQLVSDAILNLFAVTLSQPTLEGIRQYQELESFLYFVQDYSSSQSLNPDIKFYELVRSKHKKLTQGKLDFARVNNQATDMKIRIKQQKAKHIEQLCRELSKLKQKIDEEEQQDEEVCSQTQLSQKVFMRIQNHTLRSRESIFSTLEIQRTLSFENTI